MFRISDNYQYQPSRMTPCPPRMSPCQVQIKPESPFPDIQAGSLVSTRLPRNADFVYSSLVPNPHILHCQDTIAAAVITHRRHHPSCLSSTTDKHHISGFKRNAHHNALSAPPIRSNYARMPMWQLLQISRPIAALPKV